VSYLAALLAAMAIAGPQEDLQALLAHPAPESALALAAAGPAALPQISEAARAESVASALMAWALCSLPIAESRPLLEQLVSSYDQQTSYWAARALGELRDTASVPALLAQMPTRTEGRRYWELAYRVPGGWVTMYDRQYDAQGQVTIPPAPEGVPNVRTTFAALGALGRIGGPEAAQCLRKMLSDDVWLIRLAAARGLGEMRLAEARGEVARLAESDPTWAVRVAAARALARIDGAPDPEPRVGPSPAPAIAFIKAKARTESSLGFEDSYFYPKMPWYHWGENIFTLTPPQPDGELRNITGFTNCRVQGLEVSDDGTRLLFSRCDDSAGTGFHVCEIGIDGTGLRQITDGNCNDVDPCYLPDGRIAFVSDRSGHHEFYHQERSRNVHSMNADGSDIRRLTFNPNQDYDPLPLSDGRIAYTSYRFYGQDGSGDIYHRGSDLNRIETQLRTINPDGTGDALLYGAERGSFYTPIGPMPESLADSGASYVRGEKDHIGVSVSFVRELPEGRFACVTPAGLTILDPSQGLACERPLFPEVLNLAGGEEVYIYSNDQLNPVGRYTSPYPAGDGRLFVAHAPWYDTSYSAYGLYLLDPDTGAMTLVYDDPAVSDVDPVVLAPRPRPATIEPNLPRRDDGGTASILCMSVFNSDKAYDRAAARYVRVLGVTLIGQVMNANASFESHALATVPLQADGSFHVEVSADRPVRFQLLDAEENVLLHETEFNYVRAGERLTCVGCHEAKGTTPPTAQPLAAALPPYPALGRPGSLVYHGRVYRSYNAIARP